MLSALDQINALSEEWRGCYREMGVLAEGLAAGESWDEEAEALLRDRLRGIDGALAVAWVRRRHEKQAEEVTWQRRERRKRSGSREL